MLIDGKKMACDACIRGHRVSGCTHTERNLKAIAKKGRPVSQCQHCRGMRKARSAHIKCDCGEKAAARKNGKVSSTGSNGSSPDATPGATGSTSSAVVGSTAGSLVGVDVVSASANGDSKSVHGSCLCNDGGRCTCALKKEPDSSSNIRGFTMPTVPSTTIRSPMKPPLQATQSETNLTKFANGHHRPTHKHHHSSFHGASPYAIPMVGHTGHTFGEHDGCKKLGFVPSRTTQHNPLIRSEQSSPDLRDSTALALGCDGIAPFDLPPSVSAPPQPNHTPRNRLQPGLSVNTNQASFMMQDYASTDLLHSAASDYKFPQYSAKMPPGSAEFPPWGPDVSDISVPLYTDSAAQSTDVTSMTCSDFEHFLEQTAVPALTNSTSGDDPEDFNCALDNKLFTSDMSSASSDVPENETYQLSATSSFISMPHTGPQYSQAQVPSFDDPPPDDLLPSQSTESLNSSAWITEDSRTKIGSLENYLSNYVQDQGFSGLGMESVPEAEELATSTMDLSASATGAEEEDTDFLWMAPYSRPHDFSS